MDLTWAFLHYIRHRYNQNTILHWSYNLINLHNLRQPKLPLSLSIISEV